MFNSVCDPHIIHPIERPLWLLISNKLSVSWITRGKLPKPPLVAAIVNDPVIKGAMAILGGVFIVSEIEKKIT